MTMSAHDWMVGVMKMSTAAMNSGFFMAWYQRSVSQLMQAMPLDVWIHTPLTLPSSIYSRHMSGMAWVRP